ARLESWKGPTILSQRPVSRDVYAAGFCQSKFPWIDAVAERLVPDPSILQHRERQFRLWLIFAAVTFVGSPVIILNKAPADLWNIRNQLLAFPRHVTLHC